MYHNIEKQLILQYKLKEKLPPPAGRSPGGGHDNLTPVFLPGESHGQRSLVGYGPWGHKESDMTKAS